jgi:hypothetical protein
MTQELQRWVLKVLNAQRWSNSENDFILFLIVFKYMCFISKIYWRKSLTEKWYYIRKEQRLESLELDPKNIVDKIHWIFSNLDIPETYKQVFQGINLSAAKKTYEIIQFISVTDYSDIW